MRLLPSHEQKGVLSAACSYIRTFPFRLPNCDEQIRIISGEEEGLYGWIAVNYLMDGFDKHEHAAGNEKGRHSSTYGFLDMGGASTQIAFEPSAVEQVKHADNLHHVHLRFLSGKDVQHPVFVTTWLGFGTNQARNRYIDQEVERHVRASDYATLPGDAEGLGAERPVVLVDDPCLPAGLMLAEARHAGYTLHGTGDFVQCLKRQAPLLNKEAECTDEPCLFDGVHVPPIDFSVNHFIGISEYWYSTQDVWGAALGGGGVYDYVAFEKHAIEFCGRNWDEIMREHRDGHGSWRTGVELSRLETQCFKAAWIVNVLHEGIGIPRIIDRGGKGDGRNQTEKGITKALDKHLADQPPHFQSLNEVDDVAISWTLGKMVLEVSKGSTELPSLQPHPHYPSSSASLPSGPSYDVPKEEWAGHTPSWKSDIRTTIAAIKDSAVLPVAAFGLILLGLWLFGLGPGAARRRKTMCGPRSPRRANFSLLPTTDAMGESAESLLEGTPSHNGRKKSGRAATSGRFLLPMRSAANRATSYLRTLTRSRSAMFRSASTGSLLPMSRVSNDMTMASPRPRSLRPSKSTPFLRNAMVTSSSTGSLGEYWNDAPSEDRSRVSTLRPIDGDGAPFQRSISSHAILSDGGQRHTSPPPMNVIPPSPLSRPTTPTARSSLTRLTPRGTPSKSDHSDSLRVVTSGTASAIGAPSPLSATAGGHTPLSNAVWESLAAGSLARERNSTSPTPGIGGSATTGAKLRTSRSQNNSQVNLAGGYFGSSHSASGTASARRQGVAAFAAASASSTGLGGVNSAASTPGTGD